MKELLLHNSDKKILVDDEDFDKLNLYTWYLCPAGYARASINKKRVYLHRHLLNRKLKKGLVTDHKNRNTLDNRKSNLRVCSFKQNIANCKKIIGKSSKYKGVRYDKSGKRRKRWMASCETNGKSFTLGRFKTEEEAALCYNIKAKEIWGKFANLNVITQ